MDQLVTGQRLKCLTVVDDFTRESPGILVGRSISGQQVADFLDTLRWGGRPLPAVIVSDNGPVFISEALDQWAAHRGVKRSFIEPGKPVQNCFIESFNGKFRDECLNQHLSWDLVDAQQKIEAWRVDYNTYRPHQSLGQQTPEEYARSYQKRLTEEPEVMRLSLDPKTGGGHHDYSVCSHLR